MIKRIIEKSREIGIFNCIVMIIAMKTVANTCLWMVYQPDIPEKLKRDKKF